MKLNQQEITQNQAIDLIRQAIEGRHKEKIYYKAHSLITDVNGGKRTVLPRRIQSMLHELGLAETREPVSRLIVKPEFAELMEGEK